MTRDIGHIARQYDAVAAEYAAAFSGEHERKPLDGEALRRFAGALAGGQPVWDLGCGPGQTAKFLKDLGVEVSGLDLSERILEEARALHPGIPFRRGDLLELECAGDTLAGAVAFYAIVHFTREQVGTAFREVFRALRPGGLFLLTFHVGTETIHLEEFLGRKIDLDFMYFPVAFIVRSLEESGFGEIEVTEREPYPEVEYPSRRAYVFARKPRGSPP
jgi:SAM-dependent methyltransferase